MVDDFVSELDLIRRNQIAFPKLESPTFYWSLIRKRAEDEAAVRLEVIVIKKLLAPFKRKVCAIDEVLVKLVALLVHVIDLIPVFAIDHKHQVWQCVWSVGVVGDRERIEFCLGGDRGKGLRAGLRKRKNTD